MLQCITLIPGALHAVPELNYVIQCSLIYNILVVIGDYTITATEVYGNQEIDKFTPCVCNTMVTFDNTRMYVTIATLEPMNQETRATSLIY